MTTLILCRHGNTFAPGETPRRVGARTDIPLVESGREQAKKIGVWLKAQGLHPQMTYTSELKRTQETAQMALSAAGWPTAIFPLKIFNEIDYGPDENMPEDAVKARVGEAAIVDWDARAIVPPGWTFNPVECIAQWRDFAAHIVADEQECVMVVTSNGIARFAPYITGDFDGFIRTHGLKMATGSISVLEFEHGLWSVKHWNIKP